MLSAASVFLTVVTSFRTAPCCWPIARKIFLPMRWSAPLTWVYSPVYRQMYSVQCQMPYSQNQGRFPSLRYLNFDYKNLMNAGIVRSAERQIHGIGLINWTLVQRQPRFD